MAKAALGSIPTLSAKDGKLTGQGAGAASKADGSERNEFRLLSFPPDWRGAREAYWRCFENRWAATPPGFDSLSLRQIMSRKCYGSTPASNPGGQGSIPWRDAKQQSIAG